MLQPRPRPSHLFANPPAGYQPRAYTRRREEPPLFIGEDLENFEQLFRAWCERNRDLAWVLIIPDHLRLYALHQKTWYPDPSLEYNNQCYVFNALYEACLNVSKLKEVMLTMSCNKHMCVGTETWRIIIVKFDPTTPSALQKKRGKLMMMIDKFDGNFDEYIDPITNMLTSLQLSAYAPQEQDLVDSIRRAITKYACTRDSYKAR
eukprot:3607045-Rhodomonas_salina.2